jgi:hypothetical protein
MVENFTFIQCSCLVQFLGFLTEILRYGSPITIQLYKLSNVYVVNFRSLNNADLRPLNYISRNLLLVLGNS